MTSNNFFIYSVYNNWPPLMEVLPMREINTLACVNRAMADRVRVTQNQLMHASLQRHHLREEHALMNISHLVREYADEGGENPFFQDIGGMIQEFVPEELADFDPNWFASELASRLGSATDERWPLVKILPMEARENFFQVMNCNPAKDDSGGSGRLLRGAVRIVRIVSCYTQPSFCWNPPENLRSVDLPFQAHINTSLRTFTRSCFPRAIQALKDMDESTRFGALRMAIDTLIRSDNNNEDFGSILLTSGHLSMEHRSEVVSICNSGRIIELLLDSGPISDEVRTDAILDAMDYTDTALKNITILLASGTISEGQRGQAFVKAVACHLREIIDLLIASGPISIETRKSAINLKKISHPFILEKILALGAIDDLLSDFPTRSRLIELLIRENTIESREGTVVAVCQGYWPHILEVILKFGPISEEARSQAALNAVKQNNAKMVAIILASGSISVGVRREAAQFALNNHNHMMREMILATSQS